MDVARVDDVYDDMMRDIDVVVPEQAVNKNVRIARYALRLQKPGEPKTKLWTTREEVAERRRKLENELRGLGRGARRGASRGKRRGSAEWQPAASANAGERPPDRPPPEAPEEAEEDEDGDGNEDGQGRAEDEGAAAGADDA